MPQQELHPGFSVDVEERADLAVIRTEWLAIKDAIAEAITELHAKYSEGEALEEDVWGTAVEPALAKQRAGYELTCSFSWQSPDDPHTISFYFAGGVLEGHSIDA